MFEEAKKIFKRGSKVLQLTHAFCADGSGCTIILKNCPINLESVPLRYTEIDDYIKTINFDDWDIVIITDISPKDETLLDLSNKIILIDHHETALKLNDHSKNRYVTEDYCGTVYLTEFCEEVFNIDLSDMYDFIELTNDYDMWYKENNKSTHMNFIYYNIWHDKYVERFIDGNIKFTPVELKFISKREQELKECYENLEVIDIGLNDGALISTYRHVNEMCHNLMDDEGYKIVFSYNPKNGNCSVRNNYEEISIGELLTSVDGGGHANAGSFVEKNPDLLKIKIEKLVKEIKDIIGE